MMGVRMSMQTQPQLAPRTRICRGAAMLKTMMPESRPFHP